MNLKIGKWYGWEMLPGYGGSPYFSPIHLEDYKFSGEAHRDLDIRFLNALYAQGVQNFQTELEILASHPAYLIARIKTSADRCVVLSKLTSRWLSRCCPDMIEALGHSPADEELQDALNRHYRFG